MLTRARANGVMVMVLTVVAWLLCLCIAAVPARADEIVGGGTLQSAPRITLTMGKSTILSNGGDISRVSMADPKIADFILLSPRQLYITAKGIGVTNLTLWDSKGQIKSIYDVEVAVDVTRLKKALHDALPEEDGLMVMAAGDSVTLTGSVKSVPAQAKALALAEALAPGKVVNLLQVAGVQQVMLEVRVAEMSKSVMKRMGFNFQYLFQGDYFISFLNNLTHLDEQGRLVLSPNVGATFKMDKGKASWIGFVDALKDNGLLRVLAEPTLVCLSGQSSSFLAGGEIPIPVPSGLGTTAIEYKSFGVGLKFTPTVLSGDRISMQVAPEVSELDFSNAIQVNGFTIPALSTRRASSVVELGDGQSFAIAGLLKENSREFASRFPFVGDIPVLGSLFRSNSFQKSETELVIIISPRLVKPMGKDVKKLPTDGYREKNDLEFYFGIPTGEAGGAAQPPTGQTGGSSAASAPDRQSRTAPAGSPGGVDGEFGHALPTGRNS